MSFRFYTNTISQASRGITTGILVTGLALIGFGFMIYLLPRFFATLAAIVFFVVGVGCVTTAVRIFLMQRRVDKFDSDDSQGYRENVRIHTEDHHDS